MGFAKHRMLLTQGVAVLVLLVHCGVALCPSGCNCSHSELACDPGSLVFNDTILVDSSNLPSLTSIPPWAIKVNSSETDTVKNISIVSNSILQKISLDFDISILEAKSIEISDNPQLVQATYSGGENSNETLTIHAEVLYVRNNTALTHIDIRLWVMPMVKLIDLSQNKMRYLLHGTFNNKSQKLEKVYLYGNELTSLHYCAMFDLFDPDGGASSNDLRLEIQDNMIPCDCSHYYLRELINITRTEVWTTRNVDFGQDDTDIDLSCMDVPPQEAATLLTYVDLETCSVNDKTNLEEEKTCSRTLSACDLANCPDTQSCAVDPSSGDAVCSDDLLQFRIRYGTLKPEICDRGRRCRILSGSVCHHGYCECPEDTVAHRSKCSRIWVPCREEKVCKLLTANSTCNGVPMYKMSELIFSTNHPFITESDCLCLLYSTSDHYEEACTVHSQLTGGHEDDQLWFHKYEDPLIVPMFLGLVLIIANAAVFIIRKIWKSSKKKRGIEKDDKDDNKDNMSPAPPVAPNEMMFEE